MLETEIKLNEARDALKAHPMCYRVAESRDSVMIYFPPGYQVDGAQMRFKAHGVSKTRAYELLINTCEKYWRLA